MMVGMLQLDGFDGCWAIVGPNIEGFY